MKTNHKVIEYFMNKSANLESSVSQMQMSINDLTRNLERTQKLLKEAIEANSTNTEE